MFFDRNCWIFFTTHVCLQVIVFFVYNDSLDIFTLHHPPRGEGWMMKGHIAQLLGLNTSDPDDQVLLQTVLRGCKKKLHDDEALAALGNPLATLS